MKFSLGYQCTNAPFIDEIIREKEKIAEVYFSWADYPNGRNSQLRQKGLTSEQAQAKQEQDLARLAEGGVALNLLFNAMCYGKDSQSRAFFQGIGNTIDSLSHTYGLASVTTTSPLIARFIKDNFPNLEVRASVNMSIGTVEGMDYAKDLFDSFYLKRELNRDFAAIRALKEWCDAEGKKLYGLANSGCLNHCSAHVFHDNLVAHEQEIAQMDNGYAFEGLCRLHLKQRPKSILERSSFIRPEEIPLYEGLFEAVKLATRVSPMPLRILRAYTEGNYKGSVTDLLEPNHSGLFYPYLLENSLLESRVEQDKLVYENFEEAMIKLEDERC
ncbi:MAG: U32 family peptidase [Clostridia bacterium]|nr:U32 family peptidase [Clostridia bacterium]